MPGRGANTMAHTHVTAPTLFVEANGIRYAYRRFREETGVPLLFISQLDHLGFSNGGYVAQAFTSCHPNVVRRLILVGTGPRGGEPATDPNYRPFATATDS